MNWSFQLYSARNFQPWSDVLATVAKAGYAQVEGFGGVYENPQELRTLLNRHGLTMPTGQFALDMLENDFDSALRIAGTLGIGTLICPHVAAELRPSDETGWKAFAGRLVSVDENCRKAGLRFAWHNHDFEFVPCADGSVPQEVILEAAPQIGWEIDVAWVARGGSDPLAWIDRHGSRIIAAHVKDLARQGEAEDEDGWADVGHGTLDWPAIMQALRTKTPATVFVMEHDNPSDVGRFARRSIATAARLGE